MHRWQLQEAKQQFSRVVEQARSGEPQVVTRHGKEVAVVLGIDDYRTLRGDTNDLKQFLLNAPPLAELEIVRDSDPGPEIEL